MNDQTTTAADATTLSVDDLVAQVHEGRIRIPRFQRGLRWTWEDVRRLFDSIVKGYPIGSILLWRRPAEAGTIHLGGLTVQAPRQTDALWVVDGQQRITSLANALSDASSDPRFALAYDLETRSFEHSDPSSPHRLPMPVLFDLQRLLKWFSEHPEMIDHLDDASRVTKAIRQYKAPAYIVRQDDESVLRDIFDRMNTYGRRLSRAEVFSALHGGRAPSDPNRGLSDISEELDADLKFGKIDDDTVLRAFLARRGPDVTREIRTEFDIERASREFPGESPEQAHERTAHALRTAVEFLRSEAHVPHFTLLPYRYLLVVLVRYFAHHPNPSARNRDLLRRWFWRAAMRGPAMARGVYTTALRTLARCVVADDEDRSVQQLLDATGTGFTFVYPKRFKSTMAEVRFVLSAAWSRAPRSLSKGVPYEFTDLADALTDRPTASEALGLFFERSRTHRSETANRTFVLGADATSLDDTRDMFIGVADDSLLRSHILTAETVALLGDVSSAAEFLERRAKLLDETTRTFLEQMTESQFEDTPPIESLDLDDALEHESDEHDCDEHPGTDAP
jgi:hypothetical protein